MTTNSTTMTTATPSQRIEMAGRQFGRWTVVAYAGKKKWLCRCTCGTTREILGASLRAGVSTSCGCLRDENFHRRSHGMYKAPIYKIWSQMIQRCHNPKAAGYSDYGGRGIKVCQEWRESFEAFLRDVGERPSQQHSIDRIDNSKGYQPGNVRWATSRQQLCNRRNNRRFGVRGESLTLVELCDKYGCNKNTVTKRLRLGWSIDDALFVPVQQ